MKKLLLILLPIFILFACQKDKINTDLSLNFRGDAPPSYILAQCNYDAEPIYVSTTNSCVVSPNDLSDWSDLVNYDCDTIYFNYGDYSSLGVLSTEHLNSNTHVLYGIYYPLDPNLNHDPAIIDGLNLSYDEYVPLSIVNIKFTDNVTIWSLEDYTLYHYDILCCEFDNCYLIEEMTGSVGDDVFFWGPNVFSCKFIGTNSGIQAPNIIVKNTVFDKSKLALSVEESGFFDFLGFGNLDADSIVFIGGGNDAYTASYRDSLVGGWYTSVSVRITNSTFLDVRKAVYGNHSYGDWNILKNTFVNPSGPGVNIPFYAILFNLGYSQWHPTISDISYNNFIKYKYANYNNMSNTASGQKDYTYNFHAVCATGTYNNMTCTGNTKRESIYSNCSDTVVNDPVTVEWHTNTTLLNWETDNGTY